MPRKGASVARGERAESVVMEWLEGEAGRGAARFRGARSYCLAFAFAASHSAFVISTKPWPAHPFWPLHEFEALLQSLWPLQEFTPSHFTLAPLPASSANATCARPLVNSAATAAAVRTLLPFIARLLMGGGAPKRSRPELAVRPLVRCRPGPGYSGRPRANPPRPWG